MIDFNNYNGHHMTLSGKEPFQKSELHELESNMLRDNVISMLLPLTWLEVNDELSFQYKIEGYRLLTHVLRKQPLTMLRYYSLLLSITDALATCYEYMLRPECCLIDEHVLYIDEQGDKLLLPYLPLLQPVYEQQGQQLLLLAVRWAELVNDLDAEGYHRILYLLSEEKLAISPLRQLLLDLIHMQSTYQTKSTDEKVNHNDKRHVVNRPALTVVDHGLSATNPQINDHSPFAKEQDAPSTPLKPAQQQSYLGTPQQEAEQSVIEAQLLDNHWHGLEDEKLYNDDTEEQMTWKHGLLVLVMLILLALAWLQLYSANQTTDNLLLCVGISVGIIALLGVLLQKPLRGLFAGSMQKRNKLQLATEAGWTSSMMDLDDAVPAEKDDEQRASSKLYSLLGLSHSNNAHSSQQVSDSSTERHDQSLQFDREQSLTPIQEQYTRNNGFDLATVQLDEAQATSLLKKNDLVLKRSMNGMEEQIQIAGASFLVGRAEEGVHYREGAKGVSRIHIEFELVNGKLHVKDAGSRNGTFLNGQLMIAYKSYPLNNGDKLQLASREGPIYERVS